MNRCEDYEDMRMECDECHTVINFHEDDIHYGAYIVCPRCGEHIELEDCQNPKMVDIDKFNELGKQGWELCAYNNDNNIAIFKRHKYEYDE